MSIASKVGQVTFRRENGVYMPAIMSDHGDLYQEYDGEALNPTSISPDFATMLPVLSYVVTSSRVAENPVNPQSVRWYFNDVEILFDAQHISTNSLGGETGHFEYIPRVEGRQEYFALKIKKNLVKAAGAAPCVIKADGAISVGNTTDHVQFIYNIPITKSVGNSMRVTIMAGDNKFFTLRTKGDSVVLKAIARIGGEEVTSNLTYKWFKLNKGAWQALSSTNQLLTITNEMVDTVGQFKVEVMQSGVLIGMDVQSVLDASDPYDILLRATPQSETIQYQGDTVTYEPWLVKRGQNTKVKDMNFYFVFTDSQGNILNSEFASTPAKSGTCDWGMCNQAGGNVAYTITTEE